MVREVESTLMRTGSSNSHEIAKKIGWGGWIRTITVLINSEVPYQLDHAPAAFAGGCKPAR
jgi:hypothetical protein